MRVCGLMGCVFLVLAAAVARPALAQQPKWRMQVDLVDGSRILGIPSQNAMKLDIGFDELTIPLDRVRRAEWLGQGSQVRVELTNNDIVSGKIIVQPLTMATLFGEVTLSMNHFKSLEVFPMNPYGWLPTQKGLIAYYTFDRPVEGEVTNTVSEQHLGTVTSGKWTELGKRGGAMKLDGSSQITIPHHEELCSQQLTVSAWVYPTGTRGYYAVILGKTRGGSWSGGYGMVYMSGDSEHVHFYVNGYTTSVAKAEVPSDKWSHLVGVCDGSTVKMYLNGQQTESVPLTNYSESPRPITYSADPLIFGSDSSGYFWNGKLDEVAIYDRALSAEEVARLFEVGATHGVQPEPAKPAEPKKPEKPQPDPFGDEG